MPKLLQINVCNNSGSTGRIAEEIGQLAINNGWDSYIAYARVGRESKSKLIKIGNMYDVYFHVLMTRLFDRHGLASTRATKRFINVIDKIKPDIIHLHNLHGYYINYKILFNYLHKNHIPIVWTLHDCWAFTGHCSHFSTINCNRWKNVCFSCPNKLLYPKSMFWDRSKKNYIDKKIFFNLTSNLILVPVSNWLSNLLQESFLSKFNKKRIYNGVNIDIFKPLPDDLINNLKNKYSVNNCIVLLGVASLWNDKKGFFDFIKLSRLIDLNKFKIILVGLSDKQLKIIPKEIIGIKRTESVEELANIYNIADIFINLTYEDNFPTTNIEALACGTPIITYNTGGSVEAVNNDTGFIVNQGDLQHVLKIVHNLEIRGKEYYSIKCRQRVVENFNKNDRYKEYIDLYNQLLQCTNNN